MVQHIKWRRFFPSLVLWVITLVLAILWVMPTLWMMLTSLKLESQILTPTPEWLPREITWTNWELVFNKPILTWYWNSFVVAFFTTVLTVVVASMSGYALARMEFRGSRSLFLIYVMALMIPSEALIIPMYLLAARSNLTDTYTALIMPLVASTFAVYLFRQFFFALPKELEDAALIDGCSRLGAFVRIALPLATPALLAVSIMTFAFSWNNFLWPMISISTDASRTVPVGIIQYGVYGGPTARQDWGVIMAGMTAAAVPNLVVFVALQKYFVRGVAQTGFR